MQLRILLISAVCYVPSCLLSQSTPIAQGLPPRFVDGSKSPRLIPDYAAYRLVLLHLAHVNSDAPMAAMRQKALYASIGLSGCDTGVLQDQIAVFIASYSKWQALAGSTPSASDEQNVRTLVLGTRDAIIKAMSPQGASTYIQYVEREKARMIIRP